MELGKTLGGGGKGGGLEFGERGQVLQLALVAIVNSLLFAFLARGFSELPAWSSSAAGGWRAGKGMKGWGASGFPPDDMIIENKLRFGRELKGGTIWNFTCWLIKLAQQTAWKNQELWGLSLKL